MRRCGASGNTYQDLSFNPMKKYHGYKDSGVEWIGKIPDSWVLTRLKFMAKICGGQDQKDVIQDNGIYPIFGSGGEFGKTNQYLHQGPSVLLGRKGTVDKPRYVDTPFWTVDTAFFTDILDGTNPRFFFYLCTTINFEIYKYGSAIPSMSRETLNNIPFPCPSFAEQTQIAQYLDHKTSQIDKLITDKEKLIELLNEERTGIINQAVTKGLNSEVPMKDSGIEWLGEIPEHWDRIRIKNLVSIKVCDGPHETPQWIDEGIVFISAEAIKDGKIDFNFKRGYITSEQHEEYCKKSRVCFGDILFCKSGSTTGKSAMVETEADFGIWSPLAIIRANPKKINNFYLFQVIQSVFFRKQVETAWTFGTQPNIGMGALENLWITLPNSNEQNEIVKYLNEQHQLFDKLKSKIQGEIQLLKEYKTALISEVVTGKVDVRDEVIAESTELVS